MSNIKSTYVNNKRVQTGIELGYKGPSEFKKGGPKMKKEDEIEETTEEKVAEETTTPEVKEEPVKDESKEDNPDLKLFKGEKKLQNQPKLKTLFAGKKVTK